MNGNFANTQKNNPSNRFAKEPKKCDRCGCEGATHTIRVRRTERMEGAASYGMVTLHYCEECHTKNQQKDKTAVLPSKKQVKNLLKNARKGLL